MNPEKSPPSIIKPNTLIKGRYRVVQTVGVGRYGVVVEVEDTELRDERLALKLLHSHFVSDQTVLARVRSEITLLRQLSHPNIVRLYDFEFAENEQPFIVLEWVDGLSLRELLERSAGGRLSAEAVVELLIQLLGALHHAHGKGIIHRDIKPENILITFHGQLKVVDFGLAKAFDSPLGLTRTGETVGTPIYMAPEQFNDQSVGPGSDLYAVGILAFEALCGVPPFRGENYFALYRQHSEQQLPKDELAAGGTPQWLIRLVERCCEKQPEHRFHAAEEVLQTIRTNQAESPESQQALVSSIQRVRSDFIDRKQVSRYSALLYVLWTITALVALVFHINQPNRVMNIGSDILTVESFLQRELGVVRSIFGYPQVSLIRPNSILEAIKHDDQRSIAIWCASGILPAVSDSDGNTVAHYLAVKPQLLRLAELCLLPELYDRPNRMGETPIMKAVKAKQADSISRFIRLGFDMNTRDRQQESPLHVAIASGLTELVRAFHPSDRVQLVSHRGADGYSVIVKAVEQGRSSMVEEVLRLGIDPDQRDQFGRSALMLAVQQTDKAGLQIAQRLLAAGALVDARDNEGKSVASYAAEARNSEALKLLSKWQSSSEDTSE